ncbi:uncharacterized protein BJ171DRAFT_521645 [Polychytrium aggregatum]|uniref:uncharacterized protein n=1 Tax=Polychytrium aggregatum TaxID=110093 RepID=UPI0022FE7B09|nr:uncharacterized protein BJ171DRAFT_521645 [Polychytrium aggregatum]KAI9197230.1 hypothetical protein BJ171DRAFT_521645 [Polychytrium aggregatum]
MNDIDYHTCLVVQYAIISLAILNHLFNMQFFLRRFISRKNRSWFNYLFFVMIFLVTPFAMSVTAALVPFQTLVLNGSQDPYTNVVFGLLIRLLSISITLYEVVTIYFSYRSLKLLQPILGFSNSWDYLAHGINLLLAVLFLLATQVTTLSSWRRVAQFVYAMSTYVAWLISTTIMIKELDKWKNYLGQVPDNASIHSNLLKPSTISSVRKVRITYYSQLLICFLGTVCLGVSTVLTDITPNLALGIVRAGTLFSASYDTLALVMMYEILPEKVKRDPTKSGFASRATATNINRNDAVARSRMSFSEEDSSDSTCPHSTRSVDDIVKAP